MTELAQWVRFSENLYNIPRLKSHNHPPLFDYVMCGPSLTSLLVTGAIKITIEKIPHTGDTESLD